MSLSKSEKAKVLKRCRELGIETKKPYMWRELVEKCLVYDLPDASLLPISTTLEGLIVKCDDEGEHYWSRQKPSFQQINKLRQMPNPITDHKLLANYPNLTKDTMIPLKDAITIFNDYFLIDDAEPDFMNNPNVQTYLSDNKETVPFAILMGDDVFNLWYNNQTQNKYVQNSSQSMAFDE